jgi:hypothetical protein
MTNPRRIKAIAGNSASCLGFSIACFTASIPAASNGINLLAQREQRRHCGPVLLAMNVDFAVL